MALTSDQKYEIAELLRATLESKLKNYARESVSMPFLSRLVQDSAKVAAYSFIHSIATSLGMSIYEEISCIIARPHSTSCGRNHKVSGTLSNDQKAAISGIVNTLREGTRAPNFAAEVDEVLAASAENGKEQKDGNVADFHMIKDGMEYYFEIKTVKPNIDIFEKSKTKLLEWVARRQKDVKVFLAFPYNPYHPEPYSRFTMQNMMHHPHDFLVGEEYWDLLGGPGTMNDVLQVFDEVGAEFHPKIEAKILEVARKQTTQSTGASS